MPRKQKQYHYIYKTTCIITNKYYIGLHSTDNLNDGYLGSGRRLKYSVKKYGRKNHTIEILEHFPNRESLIKREEEIVNDVMVASTSCMNLIRGGNADKNGRTDSTIDRIRIATKAAMWRPDIRERYLNAIKDRVISNEHIQSIKKANTGRTHSEEEKQKRSVSLTLYYQNNEVPKETRKVLSQKSRELWATRTDREEVSEKISKATRDAMWRPDVRERYLAGIEKRKQNKHKLKSNYEI